MLAEALLKLSKTRIKTIMARKDNKKIMEKASTINNAWSEGSQTSSFSSIKQTEYAGDIAEIEGVDDQLADLKAQVKMLEDQKDDLCSKLEAKSVRIANGVRGDADFGPDSPLYGAMGFVRTSERKSGLTRKPKKP